MAALIPLVFGLIGAVGFGHAEAAAHLRQIREIAVKETGDHLAEIRSSLGQTAISRLQLPAFWACAVIAFCAACYFGVNAGLELRFPSYPTVRKLLGSNAALSPREAAELHGLRLALRRQNATPEDVRELFAQTIAPIFKDPRYAEGGELHEVRIDAVRQVIGRISTNAQGPAGSGRGPASDP